MIGQTPEVGGATTWERFSDRTGALGTGTGPWLCWQPHPLPPMPGQGPTPSYLSGRAAPPRRPRPLPAAQLPVPWRPPLPHARTPESHFCAWRSRARPAPTGRRRHGDAEGARSLQSFEAGANPGQGPARRPGTRGFGPWARCGGSVESGVRKPRHPFVLATAGREGEEEAMTLD